MGSIFMQRKAPAEAGAIRSSVITISLKLEVIICDVEMLYRL